MDAFEQSAVKRQRLLVEEIERNLVKAKMQESLRGIEAMHTIVIKKWELWYERRTKFPYFGNVIEEPPYYGPIQHINSDMAEHHPPAYEPPLLHTKTVIFARAFH
jgi:hypothetical protein